MFTTTRISRTALRMIVATPLAASALLIGGATMAQADDSVARFAQSDPRPEGPGQIVLPHGDDEPNPQPNPVPDGPGEIAIPETDPEPHPNPDGPDEITNPEDEDEPGPQIPGDKTGPNPGDRPEEEEPEVPGDGGTPEQETPGDAPEKETSGKESDQVASSEVTPVAHVVPTRIDAGAGATDAELSLAWPLAAGGLVVAAGSFAARRRLAQGGR